jgi:hypothetical protein
MKIFMIHGEHTLNSYNRLQDYLKKARERGWEIEYVEKGSDSVRQTFLGQSLFTKERLLVIKDIQLLDRKLIKWIDNNHKRISSNLIIYHRGIIPQKLIKSFPNPKRPKNLR